MISLYRFSTRRQLVNNRNTQIAVHGHGQCTWYGSGSHHQDVRRLPVLSPEFGALRHTKPVLFVNNHQTEIFKLYRVFNQGVCADNDLHLTILQFLVDTGSVFLFG